MCADIAESAKMPLVRDMNFRIGKTQLFFVRGVKHFCMSERVNGMKSYFKIRKKRIQASLHPQQRFTCGL